MVSGSFQSASVSGEASIPVYTGTAKCFSIEELSRATESFKPGNIVGQGGFGTVFQGRLDDGTHVAVKVLTRGDQQGGREFVAEVEMLSRLHHRNLVKLVGICVEEMRCLVYELIPNGSVESHLHGERFIFMVAGCICEPSSIEIFLSYFFISDNVTRFENVQVFSPTEVNDHQYNTFEEDIFEVNVFEFYY